MHVSSASDHPSLGPTWAACVTFSELVMAWQPQWLIDEAPRAIGAPRLDAVSAAQSEQHLPKGT